MIKDEKLAKNLDFRKILDPIWNLALKRVSKFMIPQFRDTLLVPKITKCGDSLYLDLIDVLKNECFWQRITCTEKLWRTLQTQTVPVVMGGGNYLRDAPERVFCWCLYFWKKTPLNVVNLTFFFTFWLGFADIYWIIIQENLDFPA